MCDNALHIIENEYGDEGLSLVSLGERLHISSNYLSAIHQKEAQGETFTSSPHGTAACRRRREYLLCTTAEDFRRSRRPLRIQRPALLQLLF